MGFGYQNLKRLWTEQGFMLLLLFFFLIREIVLSLLPLHSCVLMSVGVQQHLHRLPACFPLGMPHSVPCLPSLFHSPSNLAGHYDNCRPCCYSGVPPHGFGYREAGDGARPYSWLLVSLVQSWHAGESHHWTSWWCCWPSHQSTSGDCGKLVCLRGPSCWT